MLFKQQWNIGKQQLSFFVRWMPQRSDLMYGVGNRCTDGRYVLFIDYDDTPLEWVEEEIKNMQENELGLGNAYFFKTKRGVHVIFLEKHTLGMICRFLDMTSCDKNYKTVPMQYGRKLWILRQSPKRGEEITYIGIKKKRTIIEKSQAHAFYLNRHMNVPLKDIELHIGSWDKNLDLTMGYYKIAERNN